MDCADFHADVRALSQVPCLLDPDEAAKLSEPTHKAVTRIASFFITPPKYIKYKQIKLSVGSLYKNCTFSPSYFNF